MTRPFLKWAGGKRWLVLRDEWSIPTQYERYIEPFLGGGSVFFSIAPDDGILNDRNEDLINLYRAIRDHPLELRSNMQKHQLSHSQEHYYEIRSSSPSDVIERASRFLYLNRACWNGLYRVNKRGKFNVPKGTKERVHYDTDDYVGASKMLSRIRLESSDFEAIVDEAEHGDFVFIDPPYTVKHNVNGFARYNETLFSWSDQVRLANSVKRAADRGCMIAVTNADHESVRELYSFAEYSAMSRSSVLAAAARHRCSTSEALFRCNF